MFQWNHERKMQQRITLSEDVLRFNINLTGNVTNYYYIQSSKAFYNINRTVVIISVLAYDF